jgi:hypothetical protein
MKIPTKRLDKSRLTPEEKKEAFSFAFVGSGLVFASVGLAVYDKIGFTKSQDWMVGMLALGGAIIGFVWGYIGAMEDERAGRA